MNNYSGPASLAVVDDSRDAATPPGGQDSRAGGFPVSVGAFIVHLVSWTAFCGLWAAATSYGFGGDVGTGLLMCVLALLAGASAIVIAWGLPLVARWIVAALSLIIFGGSAIAEVAYRFVPPTEESVVWTVGEPLPYIGVLVFPVVLAAALVWFTDKQGTERRARWAGAGVALASGIAVTGVGFVLSLVGPDILLWWSGVMILAGSAVGAVAALVLLAHPGAIRGSSAHIARVAGFFVLFAAMVSCVTMIAQLVYADSTGIGGTLLWVVAVPVFLVFGATLLITVFVARRRPSAEAAA